MNCPVCQNAMIALELSDVEIDYCTGCEGIWLDAGELEMLFGDAEKSKQVLNSFKNKPSTGAKPKKCPICDKRMEEVVIGTGEPMLLVDRCVKGDGLWFDRGELSDIIERAKLDEHNKIKELLADMFGKTEGHGPTEDIQ